MKEEEGGGAERQSTARRNKATAAIPFGCFFCCDPAHYIFFCDASATGSGQPSSFTMYWNSEYDLGYLCPRVQGAESQCSVQYIHYSNTQSTEPYSNKSGIIPSQLVGKALSEPLTSFQPEHTYVVTTSGGTSTVANSQMLWMPVSAIIRLY